MGLYESQREALELEDAALRAEVRTLSAQLRDVHNKLQLKEREKPIRCG